MWDALETITRLTERSLAQIMTDIDLYRQQSSLTSAVRVVILKFFRAAAQEGSATPALWLDRAIRSSRASQADQKRA